MSSYNSTNAKSDYDFWTRYRNIRKNTEDHMDEVRKLLRIEKASNCNVDTNIPSVSRRNLQYDNESRLSSEDEQTSTGMPFKKRKIDGLRSNESANYHEIDDLTNFSDTGIDFEADLCANEISSGSSTCSSISYQELQDEDKNYKVCENQFDSDNLAKWAVFHDITHVALKDLMDLLKPIAPNLTKDPRTLLSTPRNYFIKNIGSGAYHHFGIKNYLSSLLQKGFRSDTNIIRLQFNIDGIPIFKSTRDQFWPILGKIAGANLSPFKIGLFCGTSKPEDLGAYLSDFIEEMKIIQSSGIAHADTTIRVSIACFICDAPARAFVKQIKNHNAYYGCERCIQKGVWNNKVTFQSMSSPLRTDKDFRNRTDLNHHGPSPTPLLQLDVGMVSQFVLDPMHLVYLGCMKRLLWLWMKGPIQNKCRIGPTAIKSISNLLLLF